MPEVPGRWGSVAAAAPDSEALLGAPSLEPDLGVSRAISGFVFEKKPMWGGFVFFFFPCLGGVLLIELRRCPSMIGWYYEVAGPRGSGQKFGAGGSASQEALDIDCPASLVLVCGTRKLMNRKGTMLYR